jgi:mono/diheme cytochrome c family protein
MSRKQAQRGQSKRTIWFITVGALTLLALAAIVIRNSARGQEIVIQGIAAPPLPTLQAGQIRAGSALYIQHCASCHGANLAGAPDWKIPIADGSLPPPPQDSSGHTWHHPDTYLLYIVQVGGEVAYGGSMPGFGEQLTPEEIEAILTYIKSHWGKEEREFQWWVSYTQK